MIRNKTSVFSRCAPYSAFDQWFSIDFLAFLTLLSWAPCDPWMLTNFHALLDIPRIRTSHTTRIDNRRASRCDLSISKHLIHVWHSRHLPCFEWNDCHGCWRLLHALSKRRVIYMMDTRILRSSSWLWQLSRDALQHKSRGNVCNTSENKATYADLVHVQDIQNNKEDFLLYRLEYCRNKRPSQTKKIANCDARRLLYNSAKVKAV